MFDLSGDREPAATLLDNDFYACTMGNLVWSQYHDVQVSYRLVDRTLDSDVLETVGEPRIRAILDRVAALRFAPDDIAYLQDLSLFKPAFLRALSGMRLPPAHVYRYDGRLRIEATGPWWRAIWWETPLLAALSEAYGQTQLARHGLTAAQDQRAGQANLDRKIALLRQHPDVRLALMGARRRASAGWERSVTEQLRAQLPGQLLGTATVSLARDYALTPIGTMAHQLFMVAAALADARGETRPLAAAQGEVLAHWDRHYATARDGALTIFLTDTFGSAHALAHADPDRLRRWRGVRQDSGDPLAYGEALIACYRAHGIDPRGHVLLCSDGLDVPRMIAIARHFTGRLPVMFGVGTDLTNDRLLPAPRIVWKPVRADGLPTVKLSDDPGKATGTPEAIAHYRSLVAADMAITAHSLSTA